MPLRTCIVALAALCACASAGSARTTVVSLVDLDCGECGTDLAKAIVREEGVRRTAFNRRVAELTVVADASVDAFALAQAQKPEKEEYRLVLGAGHGSYIAWRTPPAAADVKQVAEGGEDVADLTGVLVPGKITVVDFSAKWCEPCRVLDDHLLEVAAKRSDVAYRKLDVGDWDTPLGKHYLEGVPTLPYVIVFGPTGQRLDAISGLDLPRLDRALEPR